MQIDPFNELRVEIVTMPSDGQQWLSILCSIKGLEYEIARTWDMKNETALRQIIDAANAHVRTTR